MHLLRPQVRTLGSIIYRSPSTITARTRRQFTSSSSTSFPQKRATIVRSMPTIPFLGSLFHSSSSSSQNGNNMGEYPDKRGEDEWRAVLSKGKP